MNSKIILYKENLIEEGELFIERHFQFIPLRKFIFNKLSVMLPEDIKVTIEHDKKLPNK